MAARAVPCVHCDIGSKPMTTEALRLHTKLRHPKMFNKKFVCGCGNMFQRKQDKLIHIALQCVFRHRAPAPYAQDGDQADEDLEAGGEGDEEDEEDIE